MTTFALFPSNPPPELVRFLDLEGHPWKAVDEATKVIGAKEIETEWSGAIVDVNNDAESAWKFCRDLRSGDVIVEPLLVLIGGGQLDELTSRGDLFDDFIITPFHPQELSARIQHLLWRVGKGVRPELISYGQLSLNIENYQAEIGGRHLDLTFMEYELLRFLAESPGQVFTREVLLSQVWGYEYFGGARTVDVHIRRLRAKMGEEHASMISTVRGVGYKLGQSRRNS